MNYYPLIQQSGAIELQGLFNSLQRTGVPVSQDNSGEMRVLKIGPDADFEIKYNAGSASIAIRYEHPVIRHLVTDWMERSGIDVDDEFFSSPLGVSPSAVRGIRARWKLDLADMPATITKIAQNVMIFLFTENMARTLSQQLTNVPRAEMITSDIISCAEFTVSGSDPFHNEVYRWKSGSGSDLLISIQSAPKSTVLGLWIVPPGAAVKIRLERLPTSQLL